MTIRWTVLALVVAVCTIFVGLRFAGASGMAVALAAAFVGVVVGAMAVDEARHGGGQSHSSWRDRAS